MPKNPLNIQKQQGETIFDKTLKKIIKTGVLWNSGIKYKKAKEIANLPIKKQYLPKGISEIYNEETNELTTIPDWSAFIHGGTHGIFNKKLSDENFNNKFTKMWDRAKQISKQIENIDGDLKNSPLYKNLDKKDLNKERIANLIEKITNGDMDRYKIPASLYEFIDEILENKLPSQKLKSIKYPLK